MKSSLLIVAACFIPLLGATARPWKDVTGRTVEVGQWRVEGDTVIFILGGKDTPVPLAKLSAEDQAFAKKWAEEHAKPAASPADAKLGTGQPTKLPNGDVVIQNLPSPPLEEEVRNYLPISIPLVLEKYHHWPSDLLALAKKMDWVPKNDTWDQRAFYQAIGKEAHTRVLFTEKLDFDDLAREINKGHPVIVWRCWGGPHDERLVAFAKQLKADPQAKLPSARDPAERKTWPTDFSGSNAITTLIIGYNRQRGEVLLQTPFWGPDYECFRMRKEEMEVSGYGFWFFDPK